jgi:hypothetical protein
MLSLQLRVERELILSVPQVMFLHQMELLGYLKLVPQPLLLYLIKIILAPDILIYPLVLLCNVRDHPWLE